jgi:GWxTD domain-containing protein
MRKLFFILLLLFQVVSHAQNAKIKAYIDTKQFSAPQSGNYVEIYLQFVGKTIKFVPVQDGIQAKLGLEFDVLLNDSVVKSDAYVLESPIAKDSIQDDFYEVKRFLLEPGEYKLRVKLSDLNNPKSIISGIQPITVSDMRNSSCISDIEIAEYAFASDEENNFQKSGYHIIPLLSNFFPTDLKKIPAYYEIYNADKIGDSIVGIIQKIIDVDTKEEIEAFSSFTRLQAAPVIPIFKTIDIEKLATGSYQLEFILTNKKLEPIAKNTYLFERSNDIAIEFNPEKMMLDPGFQKSITDDSVFYFLESLIPIAKPAEIKNIISTFKSKDKEKARKHIQAFWIQTADKKSYDAWLKYKAQVWAVEKMYHTNFQQGFETDRGRVFLKYGAPNNIVSKETSPSEYPYEIWTYNKIGKFSNKRFIFYNPDLVNNAYRILHSDMIGELKNPAWQQTLSKRNTNNGDIDDPNRNNQEHWGGNSNDYFRQY